MISWGQSDTSETLIAARPAVCDFGILEYLAKTGQKLHEIIHKETFTITRMFDRKVKSLVKNVLMDLGVKGMNLKHFMYRVEFQARGKENNLQFVNISADIG